MSRQSDAQGQAGSAHFFAAFRSYSACQRTVAASVSPGFNPAHVRLCRAPASEQG